MPNPSELARDEQAPPLPRCSHRQRAEAIWHSYGVPTRPDCGEAIIDRITAALDEIGAERDRLREALTWAVGFIDCNFPPARRDYPDMRNALALVSANRLDFGPFQTVLARAELAEEERDRLRAACTAGEHEVQQILGKALDYPPAYPDVSTVDDGQVCVGDHVAATLALTAADTIARLRADLAEAAERIAAQAELLARRAKRPM